MKRITTILLCLLMAISLNAQAVFADFEQLDLTIESVDWEAPNVLTWKAAKDAEGSYSVSVFYSTTKISDEVLDSYWPGSDLEGAERLFHNNFERYFPSDGGTCTYDYWELFDNTGWYYAAVSGTGFDTETSMMHVGQPVIASLYYERPEKELIKPTGIDWAIDENGDVITKWDNMNQDEDFYRYYLEFAFVSNGNTIVRATSTTEGNSIRVNEGWWYGNPNEYKFRVKALPHGYVWEDCAHSEWSDWSTFRSIGKEPRKTLEDILNDTYVAQPQVLDAIKNLNQELLKLDLQNKQESIDQYKKLEEKYAGEEIAVAINNNDTVVDSNKVSIVGAALNSGGADITLNFSTPKKEIVIDKSQMKNWIQFNMSLEGANYTGKLEVPVCITMPVPNGIAPARLTIFHELADGKIETIVPSISYNEIEGIYYCTFILTSFSEFGFAELLDESNDDDSTGDNSTDGDPIDDDDKNDVIKTDDVVGGNNTNNNQTQTNNKAGAPGTGDTSNLLPSILLIIIASLCLGVTVYYRKKHRV